MVDPCALGFSEFEKKIEYTNIYKLHQKNKSIDTLQYIWILIRAYVYINILYNPEVDRKKYI